MRKSIQIFAVLLMVLFSGGQAAFSAVQETQKVPLKETPERKAEPKYYVLVKAGFGKLQKPDIHRTTSFQLYGEPGSLAEHYRLDQRFVVDMVVGRRFTIGNVNFKGSFGWTMWTLENDGNFELTLPHPFLVNTMRTLSFADLSESSYNALYLAPQIQVVELGQFQFWTGLLIGFSGANLKTFNDLDFSENAPFTSSDVMITSKTYNEERFTSLWAGLTGSIEYHVAPPLSLLLELTYISSKPESVNLGEKFNLSRYQLFFGIQLNL